MNFISATVFDKECPVCLLNDGQEEMVHQDGGETHPIHRKCLEEWVKQQTNYNELHRKETDSPFSPTCPFCTREICSIESIDEALARKAKRNEDVAKPVLTKKNNFLLTLSSRRLMHIRAGRGFR